MKEEIKLLQEAVFTINILRRENELMRARLEMFDSLMSVFNTTPNRQGIGYSPDVVREIEKFIESQPKENS